MYDLGLRDGPGDTDRVRRWLIEKLALRYVNPAAWDLRRTRQDRDPPGGNPRESIETRMPIRGGRGRRSMKGVVRIASLFEVRTYSLHFRPFPSPKLTASRNKGHHPI